MLIRPRLVFPAVLVVALAGNARSAYADGIGVGAKVGPLFTTYSADNLNFKNKTGLMGGIWFGGNRSGAVGIMGEVMYAKKSAETQIPSATTDLYYLEIPVLLRVNVGSRSREKVAGYVIVGPAADIKLKAKQNDLDVSDNYEGLDIGVIGGAGVEINRFLVEGRINWGLRNVVAGNLANTTKITTRTVAILFGVRFN